MKPVFWIALAGVLGFASGTAIMALAQAVTTPPIFALACAYNTSTPTGPATGNFILAQCDSVGRFRTITGGWP